MIRGIQIKGKISYIGEEIVYISNPEEMTIDMDGSNRLIDADELEFIILRDEKDGADD